MRWGHVQTLEELGEMMARWLEGAVESRPGYAPGVGPARETIPLIPTLAAVNRAGYVTDNSQPGLDDGIVKQRATVSGFCGEEMAWGIHDALAASDLVVLMSPPGTKDGVHQIPVTIDLTDDPPLEHQATIVGGIKIQTWTGGPMYPDLILDAYADVIGEQALIALLEAWQVEVVDAKWGRDELLWPLLLDAVGASLEQA